VSTAGRDERKGRINNYGFKCICKSEVSDCGYEIELANFGPEIFRNLADMGWSWNPDNETSSVILSLFVAAFTAGVWFVMTHTYGG
jgi:hypothetical protein